MKTKTKTLRSKRQAACQDHGTDDMARMNGVWSDLVACMGTPLPSSTHSFLWEVIINQADRFNQGQWALVALADGQLALVEEGQQGIIPTCMFATTYEKAVEAAKAIEKALWGTSGEEHYSVLISSQPYTLRGQL